MRWCFIVRMCAVLQRNPNAHLAHLMDDFDERPARRGGRRNNNNDDDDDDDDLCAMMDRLPGDRNQRR